MIFANAERSHWSSVTSHFVADALFVLVSFKLAVVLRFQALTDSHEWLYLPTVLIAALFLPSVLYVCGFYSPHKLRPRATVEPLLMLLALGLTAIVVLSVGSVRFSSRLGRGVLAMGMVVTGISVIAHHLWMRRSNRSKAERTAFVVGCEEDDKMAATFAELEGNGGGFHGVFTVGGYESASGFANLGSIDAIVVSAQHHKIGQVLCSERLFHNTAVAVELRRLRYQGCSVSTLAGAFEEHFQMVPLELVSEHWLLFASAEPQLLYLRRLKRAFDLVVAGGLLLLLSPVFLVAALLVKLTSPGPLIYRQTRCGKGGRSFVVYKLRSMHVNAEADGKAQWWRKNDSRETAVGRWLRKFRVDEIPQLVNILKGEMSFVGPRPERPEFVRELAAQIPFYEERHMLAPGLTGWAQVNYCYGSSVQDAVQKLEFDLYYLKHMSLALDIFILLDTVRTVLQGGARQRCPFRAQLTPLLKVPEPAGKMPDFAEPRAA